MWDCIIVGARCAGAVLATVVARGGKRVLVIDSAQFPSDQPLSTHFIQVPGMRMLDELGLADRVRAIAPPVTALFNGFEDAPLRLDVPVGACCARRIELDAVFVAAAREAGAELMLGTRVVDVVREGERVAGVVVEDEGGRRELRGRVVVGADGRNSTIAERVGAEEYYGYDNPRGMYWAYWPRPAFYATDPRYCGGGILRYIGSELLAVFPTNRDQLLLGVTFPIDQLPAWKPDPTARLRERLAAHALTAPLVDNATPLSKTIGVVKLRFFMKRAAGPGWALVGDAGLHKDPTPGFGITDAIRDARSLGAAIIAGGGDADLERYWRQRDVESVELFFLAKDLGGVAYNNPLNRLVFEKIDRDADLRAKMIETIERTRSPFAVISAPRVIGWVLGALVRGKFGVLPPFFAAGKLQGEAKRELRTRRKLLQRALPAAS